MIDLENLERYTVVRTGDRDPASIEDLRELEGDFGHGVYPLWSDGLQSIVAFAFEPALFSEDEAREWVKKAMEKKPVEMSLVDIVQAVTAPLARALAAVVGRRPIAAARVGDWYVASAQRLALADEDRAWSWTTAKQDAILDAGEWAMYARAHLAVDMSQAEEGQKWPEVKKAYKLPVAELIDDRLHYVLAAAQAAYGALRGARQPLDVPADVKEALLKPVKAIYRKFDQDTEGMGLRSFDELRRLVSAALDEQYGAANKYGTWEGPWIVDMGSNTAIVEWQGRQYAISYKVDEFDNVILGPMEPVDQEYVRQDGSPVMLHSFTLHLGAGEEAEPDEDDGLVWKEIIHPGQWFKMDTGKLVEITAAIIKSAFAAWKAGLPKFISVPADDHHIYEGGTVPPESNRGFVAKLKLIGERLFGGFEFTNPDVAWAVHYGSIADCSVFLEPNVFHPETKEQYPWVLRHVLLTNDPLVQDLEPFNAPLPASAGNTGVVISRYTVQEEVNSMPDNGQQQDPIELSAEESALLERARALNLSAEELTVMVEERDTVRQRARDLAITQMVRALEGREECEAVVQVEGTRHYPVVVAAIESALREQPQALALTAGEDGQTSLDAIVLGIVNAIPEEGRLALAADGQPAGDRNPRESDPSLHEDSPATEEQIDELAERIT